MDQRELKTQTGEKKKVQKSKFCKIEFPVYPHFDAFYPHFDAFYPHFDFILPSF